MTEMVILFLLAVMEILLRLVRPFIVGIVVVQVSVIITLDKPGFSIGMEANGCKKEKALTENILVMAACLNLNGVILFHSVMMGKKCL